jgi:hypothetical protein
MFEAILQLPIYIPWMLNPNTQLCPREIVPQLGHHLREISLWAQDKIDVTRASICECLKRT